MYTYMYVHVPKIYQQYRTCYSTLLNLKRSDKATLHDSN